jgi:nucleotide-binding universal stress UspA family protein
MSIVLCYDGSASAKKAIAVAQATLSNAAITLLHVWNPPDAFLPDAFGTLGLADPPVAELERLALERAQTIAGEGRELAHALGLDVAVRVERNDSSVWRTILDVAEESEAELIVIGTRGRTAVQSALLGSVSGAVVHHSAKPVLVVPARDRNRAQAMDADEARELASHR